MFCYYVKKPAIYSTWWGFKFCYVSLTIHYVDKSGDETAASSIVFEAFAFVYLC